MSHKLGIEVVAEGIENKEQVDYLKRINCDMIQGYYFEKPISIEKFEEKYKNVLTNVLDGAIIMTSKENKRKTNQTK